MRPESIKQINGWPACDRGSHGEDENTDQEEPDAGRNHKAKPQPQRLEAITPKASAIPFRHNILLSNGWEITLRFRNVSVTRPVALLPGASDEAAGRVGVARSAWASVRATFSYKAWRPGGLFFHNPRRAANFLRLSLSDLCAQEALSPFSFALPSLSPCPFLLAAEFRTIL